MTFTLIIKCDNAAFGDDPRDEIARILRDAAKDVIAGAGGNTIRDINGNRVGEFTME